MCGAVNERPNRIDAVELIAVTASGAQIIASQPLPPEGIIKFDPITLPADGIVLRARGRRTTTSGPQLLFYTNPIRVRTHVGG